MDNNYFDIIKAAYQSHLLARDDAAFREIAGVTFDTIYDRRHDSSAMESYYGMLESECRRQCGESLAAMVGAYMEASDACSGEGFDWLERKQKASRKKFCRWLFRKAAAPCKPLKSEEERKFSPKSSDTELLRRFYPEGIESGRSIDLIFTMLITFDIVRPYGSRTERVHRLSDAEIGRSADALEALVEQLRDDTPQMGTMPKPLVFDIVLDDIRKARDDSFSGFTIAKAWNMLHSIEDACYHVSSPQKVADSDVETTGYSMPGIWVDDADEGASRFWIFPENKYMAFCYREDSGHWSLTPYEFAFTRMRNEEEMSDLCFFVTARGNEQIIRKAAGSAQRSELVAASYTLGDGDGEFGRFGEIAFEVEAGERPDWFDWKAFRRLSPSDPRHEWFMQAIADIYNVNSPLSMLFRNKAPFLTDSMDALLAIDRDYLYIHDMEAPDRFAMRCDRDDEERFWYEPVFRHRHESTNLLNAEISEEHPLYVVPRFTDMDRPMSERQRRFAEAAASTDFSHQVTIYRTPAQPSGVLCFNSLGAVFPLDGDAEELRSWGVKRRVVSF